MELGDGEWENGDGDGLDSVGRGSRVDTSHLNRKAVMTSVWESLMRELGGGREGCGLVWVSESEAFESWTSTVQVLLTRSRGLGLILNC